MKLISTLAITLAMTQLLSGCNFKFSKSNDAISVPTVTVEKTEEVQVPTEFERILDKYSYNERKKDLEEFGLYQSVSVNFFGGEIINLNDLGWYSALSNTNDINGAIYALRAKTAVYNFKLSMTGLISEAMLMIGGVTTSINTPRDEALAILEVVNSELEYITERDEEVTTALDGLENRFTVDQIKEHFNLEKAAVDLSKYGAKPIVNFIPGVVFFNQVITASSWETNFDDENVWRSILEVRKIATLDAAATALSKIGRAHV